MDSSNCNCDEGGGKDVPVTARAAARTTTGGHDNGTSSEAASVVVIAPTPAKSVGAGRAARKRPRDDGSPREKLLTSGPSSPTDAELLAIFLRTGTRGKTVMDLARDLLVRFAGLHGLLEADTSEVIQAPGMGVAKHSQLKAGLELTERYLTQVFKRGDTISDPGKTRQFLKGKLRSYGREVFACLGQSAPIASRPGVSD